MSGYLKSLRLLHSCSISHPKVSVLVTGRSVLCVVSAVAVNCILPSTYFAFAAAPSSSILLSLLIHHSSFVLP